MMHYDFDTVVDRKNTGSLKWKEGENELPMWVADMDFRTAPEIVETIMQRASQGIFGYQIIPEEWARAYAGWWEKRYDFRLREEWLLFCTGVVPAISSIVRKLTAPGEKVLIQPPVYHVFFHVIQNNDRQVRECPLRYDGERYEMDFEELERGLADPETKLMILCSPHNPVGKIWSREELERVGELCAKYRVTVVSDEIHCDLSDPGCRYVPFASVSDVCRENSITCVAPTKTFNLAGIKTAAVFVPEEKLREKVDRAFRNDGIAEANAFAADAAVAAYTRGGAWLDALQEYLYQNKKTVEDFLERESVKARVVPGQATYLLWLDCSGVAGCKADLADFLRRKTGLFVSGGSSFGGNGEQFLRVNIACPRTTLLDGLQRLKDGLEAYERRSSR